jgi:hypothetical protein
VESDWRHSRVRVGLELNSDFHDEHRFSVAAMHVLSWLNPWGGELRTLARLGSTRHLGTEWWQPLGPGSPWFGSLAVAHSGDALDTYSQRLKVLRLGVASNSATLALGRQVGSWGEVSLGLSRRRFRGSVLLPEPAEGGSTTVSQTTRYVQVALDTLAVALKGAPPSLRDLFIANMTQTMAANLRVQMDGLPPVRVQEVQLQQRAIVRTARQLADQNELSLERSGKPGSVAKA